MSDLIQKIKEQQDKDEMLRSSLEINIRLYTDPSHFFYELLQNAEDAQAKIVKFVLNKDKLDVFHDGKPFTFSNLQSLCNVGKSDKIGKLNQIGEFGVGFKAVFSICDTVKLYSEPNHFRNPSIIDDAERFSIEIVDFVAPNAIEFETIDNAYTTRFVFPYCVGKSFSGYKTINELTIDLSKKLQNLGITTLLFMQNLELIEYEINIGSEQKKGEYLLDKKEINDHCMFVSALGNSKVTDKDISKDEEISYLKFSRPLDDLSSKTVDIAFPVKVDENNNYTCINGVNSPISVYFPTETDSKLRFIVQGPFRTTPDRAKIPENNDENKNLAQHLSVLLKQSLLELRDAGKLNMSFLKILPLKLSDTVINELFLPLYLTVNKLFIEEEIIENLSGEYINAAKAKLALSKDLTEIFNDRQLTLLINDGRNYNWLPTFITQDNREYKQLYEYFYSVLKIQRISPDSLKPFIDKNEQFFSAMTDNWLIAFYRFLANVTSAVLSNKDSGLRVSKIIKTSDGSFVAAYRREGGQYIPNVFLPFDGLMHPGINFVDFEIYKRCKEFFDDVLRIQKPDEYEFFIKDIRLRYEKDKFTEEEHIRDVKFLIKYLSDKEQGVKEVISGCFKFRCDDGLMRNIRESTVYLPISTDEIWIKEYFRNISDNEYFIDAKYYFNNGIDSDSLCKLGIINSIVTGEYSGDDFFDYWKHFSIEKISDALKYISVHSSSDNAKIKSCVIMKILFEYSKRLSCRYDVCDLIKYLRGEEDSSWDRRWVYTNSGELVSTESISKYDLDEKIYGPVMEENIVYELLRFKKTDADKADELRKQVSPAILEAFFNDELKRRYHLTPEKIRIITEQNGDENEENDNEELLEFPSLPVKNFDTLKKHVAEVLTYADPVTYSKVVRSIRVSNKSAEARAYIRSIYRYPGTYKFACQMCHDSCTDIEAVQVLPKPKTELDQMHLCLCPNCAVEYRRMLQDDYNVEMLKEAFKTWNIDKAEFSEKIIVSIDQYELWFTQTHFAEIQELLRLMDDVKTQKSDTEIFIDKEGGEESGLEVFQGYLGKIFKKRAKRNNGYDYIGKAVEVDENRITIEIIERFDGKEETKVELALNFNREKFEITDGE